MAGKSNISVPRLQASCALERQAQNPRSHSWKVLWTSALWQENNTKLCDIFEIYSDIYKPGLHDGTLIEWTLLQFQGGKNPLLTQLSEKIPQIFEDSANTT